MKSETMTSVTIATDVWRWWKAKARRERRTMSGYIEVLLERERERELRLEKRTKVSA